MVDMRNICPWHLTKLMFRVSFQQSLAVLPTQHSMQHVILHFDFDYVSITVYTFIPYCNC